MKRLHSNFAMILVTALSFSGKAFGLFPPIYQVPFKEGLQQVAWNPNGEQVAFGGFETIVLCNLSNTMQPELLKCADRGCDGIVEIAFSPDGGLLAHSTPYNVLIWDLKTKKVAYELNHGYFIGDLKFNIEGTLLVVSGFDEVIIWDFKNNAQKVPDFFKGDEGTSVYLSRLYDANTFLSNVNFTNILWDLKTLSHQPVKLGGDEIIPSFGVNESQIAYYNPLSLEHQVDFYNNGENVAKTVKGLVSDLAFNVRRQSFLFTETNTNWTYVSVYMLNPKDLSMKKLINLNSHGNPALGWTRFSDDGSRLWIGAGASNTTVGFVYIDFDKELL